MRQSGGHFNCSFCNLHLPLLPLPQTLAGEQCVSLTCRERNLRGSRKGSVRPCKHYGMCAGGESASAAARPAVGPGLRSSCCVLRMASGLVL